MIHAPLDTSSPGGIGLTAKLGFSAWMLFWAPVIVISYGPQNFFWLCNIALFLILFAVWTEHRLLLSSQAGVVCLVGAVWTLDLLAALLMGGMSPTGFTAYMFNPDLPWLARMSSLYHVGAPLFLLWLLARTGYDARGPWLQCLIGAVGIVGGWLFTEPYRNVNWFHNLFGYEHASISDPLWAVILVLAYPLVLFFPGHFLVRGLLSLIQSPAGRRP